MKKLLLATLVLATIFSCGKKNSVASTNQFTVSNPISSVNTDQRFVNLSSIVSSNRFNLQNYQINYYTEYHFADITNTCVTKDGWFGIDYQSCKSTTSNETTILNNSVNVDSKRADLVALLNKTVIINSDYNGIVFTIRTSDNITYVIDTKVPIQANPVYTYNNGTKKSNGLIGIR